MEVGWGGRVEELISWVWVASLCNVRCAGGEGMDVVGGSWGRR